MELKTYKTETQWFAVQGYKVAVGKTEKQAVKNLK